MGARFVSVLLVVLVAAAPADASVGARDGQKPGDKQPVALTSSRPGVINVRASFGTTDGAIRNAIDSARATGRSLYFSSGTYTYQGNLVLDGVSAYGDGGNTILQAASDSASAVILRGNGASLRSVLVTSPRASARSQANAAAGVAIDHASNFAVENVVVDRAAGAGIIADGAASGSISNNKVSRSLADGIHVTGTSHDIVISANVVRDVGDDMIAVVSYLADPQPCRNITISRNDVRSQSWGRGISTVGGEHVRIIGNKIAQSSGAGILVNSDGVYGTYGTLDVRVVGNTIDGTDLSGIRHGGIQVSGQAGSVLRGTVISGNILRNTGYRGIFVGSYTQGTSLSGNQITNTGAQGIYVDGARDVSITRNTLSDVDTYGLYISRATTGRLVVDANTFQDINSARLPSVDVIHVESSSALDSAEVTANVYSNPGGFPFHQLVECLNSQVSVARNSVQSSSVRLLRVRGRGGVSPLPILFSLG